LRRYRAITHESHVFDIFPARQAAGAGRTRGPGAPRWRERSRGLPAARPFLRQCRRGHCDDAVMLLPCNAPGRAHPPSTGRSSCSSSSPRDGPSFSPASPFAAFVAVRRSPVTCASNPATRTLIIEAVAFAAGTHHVGDPAWMSRLYIMTDFRNPQAVCIFSVDVFDCPLRKSANPTPLLCPRTTLFLGYPSNPHRLQRRSRVRRRLAIGPAGPRKSMTGSAPHRSAKSADALRMTGEGEG